jgi:hypothetical protein
MIDELDDAFWNHLVTRIGWGEVIPVVGPGAVTFGLGDELLFPGSRNDCLPSTNKENPSSSHKSQSRSSLRMPANPGKLSSPERRRFLASPRSGGTTGRSSESFRPWWLQR